VSHRCTPLLPPITVHHDESAMRLAPEASHMVLPPITVHHDESAVRLAPEASHTVPYG